MPRSLVAALATVAPVLAQAADSPHHFEKQQLSDEFHCEGATAGDLNRDGRADLIAGPWWFEGPTFEVRHELYPPAPFDRARYSNNFFAFVEDFDADGWNDVLVIGFPGQQAFWLQNPAGAERPWRPHVVFEVVDNESPTFADLDGDGRRELVCMTGGQFGFARVDWSAPAQPWQWVPISQGELGGRFTHGLGVGDLSGDGKADVLWKGGWWEQPAAPVDGEPWAYHPFEFTARGGAQMLVSDVDGDGDQDVITSLHAHGHGLAWFESVRDEAGAITFAQHLIMGATAEEMPHGVVFGNLHALALADVDGDGLDDVVTGNRYWAHGGNDPADQEKAALYWFGLQRTDDGVVFTPHLIDEHSGVGTQVVVTDVDADDLPDVVVGNKMGIFVHRHRLEPGYGFPARAAAQRMTVPDGFMVDVIAAEPDLHQPIALAVDERGRVWVAEAHAYPRRQPDGEGHDRILVFADADGDGAFESRTVFADDLNLISGLEVGFGGVWVGAAPYFMFIPDRDGDLVPDGEPEILLDGWGYQDTHETLNAFVWGPDGWLYGCHGVFTHSRVGKPGTPDEEREPLNCGVWRYHPTAHRFEVFAWGSSNPWGVVFDDRGQAFITACVIPHMFHVVQGGRYHRQSGQHFEDWVYEDLRTIADHQHYVGDSPWGGNDKSDSKGGGHAHCGALLYLGDSFPERYRHTVLFGNVHGNRINNDRLTRDGSSFVASHADDFLLANDPWFRAINLRTGPDGNVFLIDWYDRQACHRTDPKIWDRGNGRLYKVSYGERRVAPIDLAALSSAELVALQLHANDWHASTARRLLQERGPDPAVHAALRAQLADAATEPLALRALWSLHVTGGLDDELIAAQLGSEHEYVRAWTLQLALESRAPSEALLKHLRKVVMEDSSPVVRLYLAAALQRIPTETLVASPPDVSPLTHLQFLAGRLLHPEHLEDRNLPLMWWYGVARTIEADPASAQYLVMSAPNERLTRFAARRVAEVGGEALDLVWVAMSYHGGAGPVWSRLALSEFAKAFTAAGPREPLEGWPTFFASCLESDDATVRDDAVKLGAVFGDRTALAILRDLLADAAAPAERRREALAALMARPDAAVVPVLHTLLDEPELRASALEALENFDDARTADQVVARYAAFDADDQRRAVHTLTRRPGNAIALLEAIRAGELPSEILDDAGTRRDVAQLASATASELLTELWGAARPISDDRRAEIERYEQLLGDVSGEPDLAAGRAVFARTCQQCHRLYGVGSELGPDLTGSNRRDRDYILYNLIDPSGEVPRDYTLTVVHKNDGSVASGILVDRDDGQITVRNQFAAETVRMTDVARGDHGAARIEEVGTSLMPENQLASLRDEEVRDLIAYLASEQQVPMRADRSNVAQFWNGVDLANWDADPAVWSVVDGEIVGRSETGLAHNDFARSHLLLGDFRLTCEVQLVADRGNSGIQFRSRATEHGMTGYQADIGPGWWGKLYEEDGRALLQDVDGAQHVHLGEWNTYEILAVGSHVRTAINGRPCVDLDDPDGAAEGIIGLQVHSGGPTEVRFRRFRIEVDPDDELITVR